MKSLAKILLLAGALLLPLKGLAQQSGKDSVVVNKQEFTPSFYVGGGPVLYLDKNEDIKERYKTFFGGKVKVVTKRNPYFANEVGISFLTSKGDFPKNPSASSNMNLISLETLMHYNPELNSNFYIAAGLAYTQFREKIKSSGSIDSFSSDALGLILRIGLSSPKEGYFLDASYKSHTGNDFNGFEFSGGVTF